MSDILAVRDVVKTFGSVRAVDGVPFSIRRGTITGLLGRNGAGKTTTIRILLGTVPRDSGDVLVGGFDPLTEHQRAATLFGRPPPPTHPAPTARSAPAPRPHAPGSRGTRSRGSSANGSTADR